MGDQLFNKSCKREKCLLQRLWVFSNLSKWTLHFYKQHFLHLFLVQLTPFPVLLKYLATEERKPAEFLIVEGQKYATVG